MTFLQTPDQVEREELAKALKEDPNRLSNEFRLILADQLIRARKGQKTSNLGALHKMVESYEIVDGLARDLDFDDLDIEGKLKKLVHLASAGKINKGQMATVISGIDALVGTGMVTALTKQIQEIEKKMDKEKPATALVTRAEIDEE